MDFSKLKFTDKPERSAVVRLMAETFTRWDVKHFQLTMAHHPAASRIKEAAFGTPRGKVVAYANLFPVDLVIGDIQLKTGQIEFVATSKKYRNTGLFGKLHQQLVKTARRNNIFLLNIYGIPGFYKRLGYEYSIPIDYMSEMKVSTASKIKNPKNYSVRRATIADTEQMCRIYRRSCLSGADIYIPRDIKRFRVFLQYFEKPFKVNIKVVLKNQKIEGYFYTFFEPDTNKVFVAELSGLNIESLPFAIKAGAQMATKKKFDSFWILGSGPHPVFKMAQYYGAGEEVGMYRYALQSRIVDFEKFLKVLFPLFETRIAASPFKGVTTIIPLVISENRSYAMSFEKGRISGLKTIPFPKNADRLSMGINVWARMILGDKKISDLADSEPDFRCSHRLQPLAEVLFPPNKPWYNYIDGP